MEVPNTTWPWLIPCGPLEVRRGKGKEVLDIFLNIAKKVCREITVVTTEDFSAYSEDENLRFRCAEIYLEFFFKRPEANYNFRIHTKIAHDVEYQLYFSFEKGELGAAGYGTDWERIDYYKLMSEYPFFQETYTAFLKDVVSKIQERFPGIIKI